MSKYVLLLQYNWLYYFYLLRIRKTEEGTVIDFTPNDGASSEQQNNQPLLNSTPNCDLDQTSIMISSSNGTITGDCSHHELMADNSLFPTEDDVFTSSSKPNRKMGVGLIAPVIESK